MHDSRGELEKVTEELEALVLRSSFWRTFQEGRRH